MRKLAANDGGWSNSRSASAIPSPRKAQGTGQRSPLRQRERQAPLTRARNRAITSTGPTKDLRAALAQVNMAGIARPYWIASTDVGKFGSTLATFSPAFAAASVVGGELANLPLLVSSGVPSGTLYLVDAAGIAADAVGPTVAVSSNADLQMDSSPTMSSATPTATTAVSMFATNSSAVKAVAVFGAAKLRADAVAVVTGITTTTWAA